MWWTVAEILSIAGLEATLFAVAAVMLCPEGE